VSRLKAHLLPYLPVIILPVILFAGPLIRFEALYWGTPGLQFIPWRVFAWESFTNGSFPLWNPYSGMGAPFIANYQTALFYPPGWILFLFAAFGGVPCLAWAHTLLVVMHLIWAGMGMIRLTRWLGLGELAQAVGAMCFALGGYVVARSGFASMVWTAAWLPWIILGASQISSPIMTKVRTEKRKVLLTLAVPIALMLLAGHAQLSWYILLIAFAWILFGGIIQSGAAGAIRSIFWFIAAGVAGALLAAIQLLPTAEYLLQSQRSNAVDYEAALSYSFWPWRFLTLLAPDLFGNPGHGNYWGYANYWEDAIYIGVLPILLALGTLSMIGRKKQDTAFSPLVRFLWIMIAAGFLLALGKFTPIFPLLYQHVPTFDMFNGPARFLIWPFFALSLLASISIDRWRTPGGKGLYWLRLSTAGGFAITLGAFLAWFFLQEISPTFIRATALAGIWGLGAGLLTLFIPNHKNMSKRVVWQWLVVIWIGLDLLAAGWNNNPTVGMGFYQNRPSESGFNLEGKRIYLSPKDDYYLKFRRFMRFEDFRPIEDTINLRRIMMPNLNLLDQIHSANNYDPMIPGRYERWMQSLHVLNADERQHWLAMMDVGLEAKLDMHHPLGVRYDPVSGGERLRWYDCAVFVDNEETAFEQVKQQLSMNRMDLLILEGPVINEDCTSFHSPLNGYLKILHEQPGMLSLQVETDRPGWVFLADTWYPGWQAQANGQDIEIMRANYLFRAVAVPAGSSEISLDYRPTAFFAGMGLSLVGWIFVLISIIMMKVSSNRSRLIHDRNK
jgi:uncharacterized membrane protein YfhO